MITVEVRDRGSEVRTTKGFTLFETLVAMFVMLVGLLGVTSMFNSGMKSRVLAEEIVLSQELANMWADWVRFRLNDSKPSGYFLHSIDLVQGASGDFFQSTASGNFNADPNKLPTYQKKVYQGFLWQIGPGSSGPNNYKPQWVTLGALDLTNPANLRNWDQRLDNANIIAASMGSAPANLTQVELIVTRAGRSYRFNYVFSGVGVRY